MIDTARISYDLQEIHARHPAWQRLVVADDHIRRHCHRSIVMEKLTALSGMSIAQIERYCKRIPHLTLRQMIHKVRPEKATKLLVDGTPIANTVLQCGRTDHSTFSHQLKTVIGSTPYDFRLALPG